MPHRVKDGSRLVVPRWRNFRTAAQLQLLDSVGHRVLLPSDQDSEELEDLRERWDIKQTPSRAAELLDLALITGNRSAGLPAAAYLQQHGRTELSRKFAGIFLDDLSYSTLGVGPPKVSKADRHIRIADLKRKLAIYPKDSVRWVDLAREYSILGQDSKATRAINIALALEPHNRFVLRAASRFFLHLDDPLKAQEILETAARVSNDPWILSAEIATAELAGRKSKFTKAGQSLVMHGDFDPLSISELAGALGTLEYKHGNRKRMKYFISRSMERPTENSVAQVGWLARQQHFEFSSPDNLSVPRAYEARAWKAFLDGRYEDCVEMAIDWHSDEPYSTRPVFFGCWVSLIAIGDINKALEFLAPLKESHPDDPRLISNLVYSHSILGNLATAENYLAQLARASKAHPELISEAESLIVIAADKGLLSYRKGLLEEGRRKYLEAIEIAARRQHSDMVAIVLLHQCHEESRLNTEMSSYLLEEARRVLIKIPHTIRPAYQEFFRRIETKTSPHLTLF